MRGGTTGGQRARRGACVALLVGLLAVLPACGASLDPQLAPAPAESPTLLIVNESGENVRVELDGRALPYLPVNANQCVVLLQRQLGRIAVKAADGTLLAAARVSEPTWTRRGWKLTLRAASPRSYRYELLALLPAPPCEVPP